MCVCVCLRVCVGGGGTPYMWSNVIDMFSHHVKRLVICLFATVQSRHIFEEFALTLHRFVYSLMTCTQFLFNPVNTAVQSFAFFFFFFFFLLLCFALPALYCLFVCLWFFVVVYFSFWLLLGWGFFGLVLFGVFWFLFRFASLFFFSFFFFFLLCVLGGLGWLVG